MDKDLRSRYSIARELGVSETAIRKTEERALRKLRRNPLLRQLFEEMKDEDTRGICRG